MRYTNKTSDFRMQGTEECGKENYRTQCHRRGASELNQCRSSVHHQQTYTRVAYGKLIFKPHHHVREQLAQRLTTRRILFMNSINIRACRESERKKVYADR